MFFLQSNHNYYIFIKKNIIVLSYVDDCLILAQRNRSIDQLLQALNEAKFESTKEGSVNNYSGVKITSNDLWIELTWPYFTEKIIKESDLDNTNPKNVPVVKPLLQKASQWLELMKEPFYYRSLIGILSYLCGTRPDICMATHQASRF